MVVVVVFFDARAYKGGRGTQAAAANTVCTVVTFNQELSEKQPLEC